MGLLDQFKLSESYRAPGLVDAMHLDIPQISMPAPGKKSILGGPNSLGRTLLGGLLDGVSTHFGGNPVYSQMQTQKREMDMQEQQYQRRTGDELNRQIALEQWKRNNPKPEPTNAERELSWWHTLTPAQRSEYASMQDVKAPAAVAGPTGTYRVPRSYGQVGLVQPTPEAVAYFKAHPETSSAFDEMYGAGASAQYGGGPTQPASGGFR